MRNHFHQTGPFIDANGCLAEREFIDGVPVIVHYDDIPESDITTVQGVRCTTALRTIIDIAPELSTADLNAILREFLRRRLFTPQEAIERVSRPDMTNRAGAQLLRRALEAAP